MCGICGMAGAADAEALERMMDALRHRGPDDSGALVDDEAGVALGHLRLSIIDVACGRQPIFNEDRSLAIVFNGEIYNYRELRHGLLARGHRLATNSDTEVILHLYEELGARTPEKLQGMFAFAIWDSGRRELFLARDRLGVKPLFYVEVGGRLAFASELKGVLAAPWVGRDVDPLALDQYLTFMYVPAPRTIIRGVNKLEPGCSLLWRGGRVERRRYWELPRPGATKTAKCLRHAAEETLGLLGDAVSCRLMSEVPLGAYLSGGLDSSLVVALMSRAAGQVDTFSVGFDEQRYDESPFAQIVADRFKTRHHRLSCRQDAAEELGRIFRHLDEPVADAAAIPTYLMAQATKPHATVVLTGEGADELFAGYSHYKILALANALGRAAGGGALRLGWGGLAGRAAAFAAAAGRPSAAYMALKSVFAEREKAALLRPEWRRPADADPPEQLVAGYLDGREGDYLQRLLRMDLALWLPDDLLVKVDRMTMAHAVEGRVPFLDYRVVEAVMALPSGWKLRGGVSKYLLRRMGEGLLPREIVWRKKTGFAVPVGEWSRQGLKEMAADCLGRESVERRGWLDADVVARLLVKPRLGMFERRQFWTVFSLEMWARGVLDR